MSIFKCKMCGGTLEINENQTTAVCEYCGTKQTLPKLDDDRRANLYDRANHFRRNNEFDKAMSIYEKILTEDGSDAEAYWSLVLCSYGIEYVEDPATHKRVPTVNRAQFTSIFDDDNYKSALKYADGYQKAIYEEEANAINEIQKGILAISQNEEPFDVFICYKETDANGRRTQDSVLANDLYHQLIQEGFKVFFSRITLEDKLGTAYEPYIFAALNSAKVMVVLGTKPEYFNAVWVRNEWARYLALVKNSGGKKVLIPAYKDMDPYDLPEEFSHLQAQDMSKLGFMQDLIRGIKKLAEKNTVIHSNTTENKTEKTTNELALQNGGLYLGESFAGKPHGKGKCIYPSGCNYVGEWAFGKFNGNGTYTYKNGKTWTGEFKDDKKWSGEGYILRENGDFYEGTLMNGNYNGNGTYTYKNGKTWIGEWKDGKDWCGEGYIHYKNDDFYEGTIMNGCYNGKGTYTFNDGSVYVGEFKDGKYNGNGTLTFNDGCAYVGEFKDGKYNGNGTFTYKNGKTWTGEWKDDKRWNGDGYIYYKNDDYYEGPIMNGKYNGNGAYTFKDGRVYVGEYKDGIKNGNGTFTYNDGRVYVGEYKDGKCNGNGTFTYKDGKTWTGEFKDGKEWCGNGIVKLTDGDVYDGEWKDGAANGKGEIICHDGSSYNGEFKDGELWNGSVKTINPNGINVTIPFRKGKRNDSGCYVATCVYGSYDCPQVWTLRRYRDNTLAQTWYGRAFIRTYYAISPTLVKWFGATAWFKKMWIGKLNRMVAKLQSEGVESTPYEDKIW